MANETVTYWAATQFAFFGCALLGCAEQGTAITKDTPSCSLIPQNLNTLPALLRLLTPVMKAQVSLTAVSGIRSAMECLGGVGYCENHEDGGILNLAKIFRDSVVNTIWEGTVSVMADDVGRVIRDKRIAGGNIIKNVFVPWVAKVLGECRAKFPAECNVIEERIQALVSLAQSCAKREEELEYRGRDFLEHLEAIAAGTILLFDANLDGDEVVGHIASRYIWSKAIPKSQYQKTPTDWKLEAKIDCKIFLGSNFTAEKFVGKL
jgi:hypothetical protein